VRADEGEALHRLQGACVQSCVDGASDSGFPGSTGGGSDRLYLIHQLAPENSVEALDPRAGALRALREAKETGGSGTLG